MSERFAVGDAVTYRDVNTRTTLQCRVIRVMPSDLGSGHYRIRDLGESFERAVAGNFLTRSGPSDLDKAFEAKDSKT